MGMPDEYQGAYNSRRHPEDRERRGKARGGTMGILELHNTETQVVVPQASDMEATFGLAALKALDLGNKKVLDAILKLREDARKTMEDLADLVHELSAETKGKTVQQKKSIKAVRGKRTATRKTT